MRTSNQHVQSHRSQLFTAELQKLKRQANENGAGANNADLGMLLRMKSQMLGGIDRLHADFKDVHNVKGEAAVKMGQSMECSAANTSAVRNELTELTVTIATEEATQTILCAAEKVDETVESLKSHAQTDVEKGALDDVAEQVVKIFEACNF